ncbi:MAG: DNA polymerase III subunit beta [Xanthomonadales bacterium]|nr:DNA polymerase III subunit beta [Xanthomonadales bacterium]
MKFSIQREVLLRPLTQVVGVVERRQTLPVLANLLLNASENEVQFTGTDLEVELTARVQVEVDQPGEVTIPARKLLDICKALPDGTRLDIDIGAEKATIRAGRSRYTLATLPATEFPVIEDVDVSQSVQIGQGDLKKIIDGTSFAMANQDVRYYLNGLLLELRKGMLRSVATDGHRLAIADVDADLAVDGVEQMIIPRKGVLELVRLLDDKDDDLTVQFGRSHVRVQLSDGTFTSKLIDGKFPDYESVVPIGADKIVTGDRELIREALQRAAILSNEKYRGVRLELDPEKMRIVAHNPEQEEAVEEVELQSDVEQLAVGFNVNYLLEALNALDSDDVSLCFKDTNSSCLAKAPDTDRSRHVVMPLRL